MSNDYSDEFKQRAVRLSEREDTTCEEVAEDLGMSVHSLYRWRKDFGEDGEDAFPGRGNQHPEDERISELERENRKLREERDIFKKAMSIFADKE